MASSNIITKLPSLSATLGLDLRNLRKYIRLNSTHPLHIFVTGILHAFAPMDSQYYYFHPYKYPLRNYYCRSLRQMVESTDLHRHSKSRYLDFHLRLLEYLHNFEARASRDGL